MNNVTITRIRYSVKFFENPIWKICEEITFLNTSETIQDALQYPLDEYRAQLNIFDKNREQLFFYSSDQTDKSEPREITIELPKHEKWEPGSHLTIFIEYLQEFVIEPKFINSLKVDLNSAPHTYINIEKNLRYTTEKIELVFCDHEGQCYSVPSSLENKGIIHIFETSKYLDVKITEKLPGDLLIGINYALNNDKKRWYTAGIILGVFTIFLNFFYLTGGCTDDCSQKLQIIIGLSTLTASYLIFVKTWQIPDEVSYVFYLILGDKKIIQYSTLFLILIYLIFIEIVFISLFYYVPFPRIDIYWKMSWFVDTYLPFHVLTL